MSDPVLPISGTEFEAAEGLADWRVLNDGGQSFYRTASFAESMRFAAAVAQRPSVVDHPPAVDIRADGVTLRVLTTGNEYYGMSQADVDVAREISAVAGELGLVADPSRLGSLLIVPGAPAGTDIVPFWRAVLGYVPRTDSPDEDLVDPQDRGAPFWFEEMNEPRGDGGGTVHVAIWLPADEAAARVQAALAAGGRVVLDRSPSWVTLADPAGNEADVATVVGRD